ncbi:hypothetical protein DMI62_00370 [Escherichia coli]|nr:hypothetical protein [Escherichia coli]
MKHPARGSALNTPHHRQVFRRNSEFCRNGRQFAVFCSGMKTITGRSGKGSGAYIVLGGQYLGDVAIAPVRE